MKRGQSGLSLVVGVDKPRGVTSHGVVNTCRCIFNEKRVGHTGTLDPLATGVLPVCIGSATKLSQYLTSDVKTYVVRVVFGASTDTDDIEGTVLAASQVPAKVFDTAFAQSTVKNLIGPKLQLPPTYSAIKVAGKKSYEEARKGNIINLKPRAIEILAADLVSVIDELPDNERLEHTCRCAWDVRFTVSKGTYIRSIARDLGNSLGCYGHVAQLRRLRSGAIEIAECVSLEELALSGTRAALDPVYLLGNPIVFVDGDLYTRTCNGAALPSDVDTFVMRDRFHNERACGCVPSITLNEEPLHNGQMVSVVGNNRLMGLYCFNKEENQLRPSCVFSGGVSRGGDI